MKLDMKIYMYGVDDLVDAGIILPRHFQIICISMLIYHRSPHVTNVLLRKGQKLSQQSLAFLYYCEVCA